MFRCADGDIYIFGALTVQTKHNCTRGCGGYLRGEFFGAQDKNKRYQNKISLVIHMCQKCADNLGKTHLTYKPTIDTEDE